MTESEFNDLVDETLQLIEDAIDEQELDVDCENSGGILTIDCSAEGNGSNALIFSRQLATQELWLAAKSGGYHYRYDVGKKSWLGTREGSATLQEQLKQDFAAQAQADLSIRL